MPKRPTGTSDAAVTHQAIIDYLSKVADGYIYSGYSNKVYIVAKLETESMAEAESGLRFSIKRKLYEDAMQVFGSSVFIPILEVHNAEVFRINYDSYGCTRGHQISIIDDSEVESIIGEIISSITLTKALFIVKDREFKKVNCVISQTDDDEIGMYRSMTLSNKYIGDTNFNVGGISSEALSRFSYILSYISQIEERAFKAGMDHAKGIKSDLR